MSARIRISMSGAEIGPRAELFRWTRDTLRDSGFTIVTGTHHFDLEIRLLSNAGLYVPKHSCLAINDYEWPADPLCWETRRTWLLMRVRLALTNL